MGQRVIIAVELKKEGKVIKRRAYHHQWGYATAGARAVLAMLMSDAFDQHTDEELDKALDNPACRRLSVHFTDAELKDFEKEDGELDMGEIINQHDNNNGGIYLQLELDEYNLYKGGRIRFYRGYEEIEDEETQHVGDEMELADYFDLFERGYWAQTFEQMFRYLGIDATGGEHER